MNRIRPASSCIKLSGLPSRPNTGSASIGQEEFVAQEPQMPKQQGQSSFVKNPSSYSQNQATEKKRHPSPPLFNYKAKFIAKQFDPFEEMLEIPASESNLEPLDVQSDQENSLKFKKMVLPSETIALPDETNHQTQKPKKARPLTALTKAATVANIFDTVKVYEQYQPNEIGPQFDNNGNLKAYSILGRPEWFLRQQLSAKKVTIKNNASEGSHEQLLSPVTAGTKSFAFLEEKPLKDADAPTMKKPQVKPLANAASASTFGGVKTVSLSNIIVPRSAASISGLKAMRNVADKNVLVQELDEDEVEACIESVLTRVGKNQQALKAYNDMQMKKLRKGDQLYLTKDARIIEKFQDAQKQQQKRIEAACKTSKKAYEDSCQLRGAEARIKHEVAEILDIAQPDIEKYGAKRYWGETLRKDQEDRDIIAGQVQKMMSASITNQKPPSTFGPRQELRVVEQIRKPLSSNLHTDKQNLLPFHSFKSQDHLTKKLVERSEKIQAISNIDSKGIEGIEVIGQSVLRSEIDTLKSTHNKFFLMKFKPDQQPAQPPQEKNEPQGNEESKAATVPHSKHGSALQRHPQSAKSSTALRQVKSSHSTLRSNVRIALPPDEALQQFLSQQRKAQVAQTDPNGKKDSQADQEEEIIAENYIKQEMKRGGYVLQKTNLLY